MSRARGSGQVSSRVWTVGDQGKRLNHHGRQSLQIHREILSQRLRIVVALAFRSEVRNIHQALQGVVDPVRQFARHGSDGGSFRLPELRFSIRTKARSRQLTAMLRIDAGPSSKSMASNLRARLV